MLRAMPDEPSSAPRKFALKPKDFERLNAPRPETAEEAARDTAPALNDMTALRHEVRAREAAAGLDEIKPPDRPRSNRRRQDFWLLLIGGNLAIVGAVAFVGANPVSLLFGLGGVVMFSLGLTWTMWFVMDRY